MNYLEASRKTQPKRSGFLLDESAQREEIDPVFVKHRKQELVSAQGYMCHFCTGLHVQLFLGFPQPSQTPFTISLPHLQGVHPHTSHMVSPRSLYI